MDYLYFLKILRYLCYEYNTNVLKYQATYRLSWSIILAQGFAIPDAENLQYQKAISIPGNLYTNKIGRTRSNDIAKYN